MHSISLICVALAAAIYYYIFYLEYPRLWQRPFLSHVCRVAY